MVPCGFVAPRRPRSAGETIWPTQPREWPLPTRLEVIASFQAFHERHGRAPTARDPRSIDGLPSQRVVKALFGSWREAKRAAGFDGYSNRRWNEPTIVDAIHRWISLYGHPPAKSDLGARTRQSEQGKQASVFSSR